MATKSDHELASQLLELNSENLNETWFQSFKTGLRDIIVNLKVFIVFILSLSVLSCIYTIILLPRNLFSE